MSVTTVQSIKKAYLDEVKARRSQDDDDEVPVKKRGRPVLIGQELVDKV